MTTQFDTAAESKSEGLTDLVREFAKEVRIDTRGSLEYQLLRDLVQGFSTNPVVARRAMRELLSRNPTRFHASALQILHISPAGPGLETLTSLLLENHLLLYALADPDAFAAETAVTLATSLARIDAHVDSKLLKLVLRDNPAAICDIESDRLERILQILDAISDSTRLVPILMRLQRHPDRRVRSKAALLIVRAHRNAEWLQSQIASPDPRIRANTIEGLRLTQPSAKELALLWKCARDSHHRVASTALLVLYENGDAERATEALETMSTSLDEPFRAAAAWAMGQTRDPRFLDKLRTMARSDTGLARRAALKASVALTRLRESV